nr:hypothetical protein [Chromobacterium sp. ASV5]
MKLPNAVLLACALGASQISLADKVWNANPNNDINNWISGMYANIDGSLGGILGACAADDAANCTVTIQANGGVHASASDASQHFTVRLAGPAAPYGACHIYPKNPAATGDKRLRGASCYDLNHQATYYKLN